MKISFHGAAGTVTGSKHLLTLDNGRNFLLDCGMFQGMGQRTIELNESWGFDPSEIDYLIVSHAHIDHTGLIPKLVRDGFEGEIILTPATLELMTILLQDSAEIQASEYRHSGKHASTPICEPLYSTDDVLETIRLCRTLSYDKWIALADDVELMFTDAGHLIGSAAVNLRIQENGEQKTLLFSGDVGRYRNVLLCSPTEVPPADHIILESTYGTGLHELGMSTPDKLLHHIENTCLKKRGKLVIPAFSVGRTQELLYALNQLELEKRLPDLHYFLDSPLSIKATEMVKRFPGCFNERVQKVMETDEDPFAFKGLKYIQEVEESQMLLDYQEPCVIIAASGMADAGRVRHHIRNTIGSISNTILMVGYCDPDSLGGQLLSGKEGVYMNGDAYDVKADVASIKSLSAHGDSNDLVQFLASQNASAVKNIFLVHGERKVQEVFRENLMHKGFKQISIPDLHETVDL
jgi:metallo-beta-lactamase family protein